MFKRYLKNRSSRIITLVLSLIIFSLFVIYTTGNGKYFLSSKASTGSVALSIEPSIIKTSPNGSGSFNVYVVPGTEKISSAELYINYDPQTIQITNVIAGNFFTSKSSTVGAPQELLKNFSTSGKIAYALGFPIGSKMPGTTEPFYSSEAGALASISYTVLPTASGQSSITISDNATEQTIIGNVYAQNVLGPVSNATVSVDVPATITPTQVPVVTAVQPTSTPIPTYTPVPTDTPTLTPTSIPTATFTPTRIPTATWTPVPTTTNTPMPTATRVPSATPTISTVTDAPSPSVSITKPAPTKKPKRNHRLPRFWEDAGSYFRKIFGWEKDDE